MGMVYDATAKLKFNEDPILKVRDVELTVRSDADVLLQLMDVMQTLTERERKVLILRYGLDGETPKTLEEVGKIFNVTRERIRQIEAKALRKLRHPSRLKKLDGFLGA